MYVVISYSAKYSIMYMFEYLQKLKIINSKRVMLFTAYIVLVGNRIIFPLHHQDFCKYCLHSFNEHKLVRQTFVERQHMH